ncbi:hypothetical protein [Chakrabartyella piscis]|uniref:hypothetical protein n=1 Tax=Chakrabartyella piscis TaxID=2918914 RepID=UPI0029586DC0|nr:hypothetical protein [Chakrabartyella piscis]
MFNFKDELSRYQPLLELDEIEHSLQSSQLKDLVDILDHIAKNSGNPLEMDAKED